MKRIIIHFFIFSIQGILIASCIFFSPWSKMALGAEALAKVSGKVTLYGEPLSDVIIRIEGDGIKREFITGMDGKYSFQEIPYGTYKITLLKEGYTFLPSEKDVMVQGKNIDFIESRSLPFLLPKPKMDPTLGKSLPLGGGEGYTLTPAPSEATKIVKAGDGQSLVETIGTAQSGDLVYVPPGEYNVHQWSIFVPDGVTVFGSRSESIIRCAPIDELIGTYEMWIMGNNSRITGLTIDGPDKEPGPSAYYKPTPRGIVIKQCKGVEIDNISITGFPHAALIMWGPDADAFIHHSYIGENIRSGLGYGVKPIDGAYVEVAYCKFYKNRHSIDSTGGSYYVHDSHFDSEHPLGVGVIFQHQHEMSGIIVIQDNTFVNCTRAIHMTTGHGVISGNTIKATVWSIALRRLWDGKDYKGYLHDLEVFDNEVLGGRYNILDIKAEDNVFLDGVKVELKGDGNYSPITWSNQAKKALKVKWPAVITAGITALSFSGYLVYMKIKGILNVDKKH